MTMTTKSMEIGICLQIRPFIAPEKKTDIRHIFFFKKKDYFKRLLFSDSFDRKIRQKKNNSIVIN